MSKLAPDQLAELRGALTREYAALSISLPARRAEARGMSRAEIEDGDVAERMNEQASAAGMVAFEQALLGEIEHALAKLDAGTYGVSEDSGDDIPYERLRVVPWARRTFAEEERLRRGHELTSVDGG